MICQTLEPFFESLKNFQRTAVLKEEASFREKFGVKTLSDKSYARLVSIGASQQAKQTKTGLRMSVV